ncbi:hypothetical protein FISHEDRAFT_74930 [Fistulina hepatica ATCC 64428]|uniref:Uncharacterized protein n=1 Tax=Fistulina hepatica ATCC 64428 TaxID=1128425 RepID=A0A0D7A8Q7_9AGAR|nr:hypothetical protein FISHEDRAFT_74930 [Fistulina hepatica ATCC 64428]
MSPSSFCGMFKRNKSPFSRSARRPRTIVSDLEGYQIQPFRDRDIAAATRANAQHDRSFSTTHIPSSHPSNRGNTLGAVFESPSYGSLPDTWSSPKDDYMPPFRPAHANHSASSVPSIPARPHTYHDAARPSSLPDTFPPIVVSPNSRMAVRVSPTALPGSRTTLYGTPRDLLSEMSDDSFFNPYDPASIAGFSAICTANEPANVSAGQAVWSTPSPTRYESPTSSRASPAPSPLFARSSRSGSPLRPSSIVSTPSPLSAYSQPSASSRPQSMRSSSSPGPPSVPSSSPIPARDKGKGKVNLTPEHSGRSSLSSSTLPHSQNVSYFPPRPFHPTVIQSRVEDGQQRTVRPSRQTTTDNASQRPRSHSRGSSHSRSPSRSPHSGRSRSVSPQFPVHVPTSPVPPVPPLPSFVPPTVPEKTQSSIPPTSSRKSSGPSWEPTGLFSVQPSSPIKLPSPPTALRAPSADLKMRPADPHKRSLISTEMPPTNNDAVRSSKVARGLTADSSLTSRASSTSTSAMTRGTSAVSVPESKFSSSERRLSALSSIVELSGLPAVEAILSPVQSIQYPASFPETTLSSDARRQPPPSSASNKDVRASTFPAISGATMSTAEIQKQYQLARARGISISEVSSSNEPPPTSRHARTESAPAAHTVHIVTKNDNVPRKSSSPHRKQQFHQPSETTRSRSASSSSSSRKHNPSVSIIPQLQAEAYADFAGGRSSDEDDYVHVPPAGRGNDHLVKRGDARATAVAEFLEREREAEEFLLRERAEEAERQQARAGRRGLEMNELVGMDDAIFAIGSRPSGIDEFGVSVRRPYYGHVRSESSPYDVAVSSLSSAVGGGGTLPRARPVTVVPRTSSSTLSTRELQQLAGTSSFSHTRGRSSSSASSAIAGSSGVANMNLLPQLQDEAFADFSAGDASEMDLDRRQEETRQQHRAPAQVSGVGGATTPGGPRPTHRRRKKSGSSTASSLSTKELQSQWSPTFPFQRQLPATAPPYVSHQPQPPPSVRPHTRPSTSAASVSFVGLQDNSNRRKASASVSFVGLQDSNKHRTASMSSSAAGSFFPTLQDEPFTEFGAADGDESDSSRGRPPPPLRLSSRRGRNSRDREVSSESGSERRRREARTPPPPAYQAKPVPMEGVSMAGVGALHLDLGGGTGLFEPLDFSVSLQRDKQQTPRTMTG